MMQFVLWLGGSVGWSIVLYTKKVVDLISGQGTYLTYGFYPCLGRVQEATN